MDRVAAAADFLFDLRNTRRHVAALPADLVPRVRQVVTDVDKKRRIERGLVRMDSADGGKSGNQSEPAALSRPTRERRREAS